VYFEILIEAATGKINDTARLISKYEIPAAPSVNCLSFYYHMKGKNVESLNVYTRTILNETLVWTRKGNQGDVWINGRVNLALDLDYKLIFESIRGSGVQVSFLHYDFL